MTPLTFAGAIRSKFLSTKANGDIPADWYDTKKHPEFKDTVDVIGTPRNEGKIRFFGVYLADPSRNEMFPCPYDVVRRENSRNPEFILKPDQSDLFEIAEIRAVTSGKEGSFYIKEYEGFIMRAGLNDYLSGEVPHSNEFKKKDQVMLEEPRVGIEIDTNTRTTRQEMFYSIAYLRLCEGNSFSAWINDSFGLPTKGILKLGGEGKAASYEVTDNDRLTFPEPIQEVNKYRRLKLYLSTPAVFLGGDGRNECIPSSARLKEKLGVSVRLISMIPGKPMRIGGWDMATGRQKPLRYAVRSGAVYFYEIKDGKIDENIEMPIMISDIDSPLGLGSAFIGGW